VELILTASGVPHDGGRLKWPVVILAQVTPNGERLRSQVEALFQVAAFQAQVGPVNPGLRREMTRAVEEIRQQVRVTRDRGFLSRTAFDEAELFLDHLKHAWDVLEEAIPAPGGSYGELQAGGDTLPPSEKVAQVAVKDNDFEPRTITVAVGTTVRWINQGEHQHTVTSASGEWDSGKLEPRARYTQTFARPGTYQYHCRIHSGEMRGTVIVK
jgi:plastocyanin